MLKPEHLDPLRDALRSLGDRLRRWRRKPDVNDRVTEVGPLEPTPKRTWASIGREAYRHPGRILLWLFLIYIGVGLIHHMVTWSSGVYGASFGFGNLYINYSVAHGGLLGDRLVYAVILQDNYPRSSGESAEHKFAFVFPGDHLVIVQPRRGETVWVDGQYQITRLGRVLRATAGVCPRFKL